MVSLPGKPHDAVPIKLRCHKRDYIEQGTNSGTENNFSSLWKIVLMTVASGKQHPPNVPKYQKNFILLIEDVVRNHPHLFTDREMSFIGFCCPFFFLKFIRIYSIHHCYEASVLTNLFIIRYFGY